MNDNQFYWIVIKYSENTLEGVLRMYWSYESVSKILIPSLSLYYGEYVSTGIYQVVVSCPVGFISTSFESPNKCTELYGDGLRVGNEECDDGNLNYKDGWNQRNIIEDRFGCFGGSDTTKDLCFECVAGYSQSNDKRDWNRDEPSKTVNLLAFGLLFSMIIGIKTSIIISILYKRYPNSIFFYLEHIQVLLLIPTIHVYFSQEIMIFFHLIRHPFLHFDFLNVDSIISENTYYDRSDLALRQLGFRSQSAVVNLSNWIITFPVLILIYCIIYFFLEKKLHQRIKGLLMSPFRKFTNWIIPGVFIKWINLSIILLVFLSYYDVKNNDMDGSYSWSWKLSVGILGFWSTYILLTLILSVLVVFKGSLRENWVIDEFFTGLQDHKISLLYPTTSLIYKASLAIIASSKFKVSSTEALGYFLTIQILYTIFWIITMPLNNWKDNFMKITCELFIIILIIPLFYYKTTNDWTNTFTWMYISFILAISVLMTFIHLSKSILS